MYSLNHASTIVNSLLREILNHAGTKTRWSHHSSLSMVLIVFTLVTDTAYISILETASMVWMCSVNRVKLMHLSYGYAHCNKVI